MADRNANQLELRGLGGRLRPLNLRWVARLDADHPPRVLNFPPIRWITLHLGYPGRPLAAVLRRRIPIVGEAPPVWVFRAKAPPSTASFGAWKRARPEINAAMVGRIRRIAGTELARQRWANPLKEAGTGGRPTRFRRRTMACAIYRIRRDARPRDSGAETTRRYA